MWVAASELNESFGVKPGASSNVLGLHESVTRTPWPFAYSLLETTATHLQFCLLAPGLSLEVTSMFLSGVTMA